MRIPCCFLPLLVLGCIAWMPAWAVAGTVYEVNTQGAAPIGSKNNGGVYIGQSVNSGSNTLNAALQINRHGLGPGSVTLSLQRVNGSPGDDIATGTSLASLTESNQVLSDTLNTFYTFSNLNWALQPNTVYMLGIASESTATVKWTLNQSATQEESTGFVTGYVGYNAQKGGGIDNGLHGATISAVPEPSTFMLAGIAGLATLVLRRRRRVAGGDG